MVQRPFANAKDWGPSFKKYQINMTTVWVDCLKLKIRTFPASFQGIKPKLCDLPGFPPHLLSDVIMSRPSLS
jgi:hypothetical protein